MDPTAATGHPGAAGRPEEPTAALDSMQRKHAVFAREGRSACVLAVELAGWGWLEETFPGRAADVLELVRERLAAIPRAGALETVVEGRRILALLSDTGEEAAHLLAELLVEEARALRLPDTGDELWVGAAVGLALDDEGSRYAFDVLTGVATDSLGVALSRGGECVVHSELYDLVQRRFAREHPGSEPAVAPGGGPELEPEVDEAPAADESTAEAGAAAPPPSGPRADRREELARKLRAAIAADATRRPEAAQLEGHLLEQTRRWAAEALEEAMGEKDREHSRKVELLEARINRLLRSLEETEETLQRVLVERETDPGVPSAYRGVQGLDLAESHYELKRELMQRLLEANLELRRQLENGGAPAA